MDLDIFPAALSLVFLLCTLVSVSGFEVIRGPHQDEVNLTTDNPELIILAALSGSNYTVQVTDPTQTVIAQHNVLLSLDCLPRFEQTSCTNPRIKWFQRRTTGKVFVEIFPGLSDRISVQGHLNSRLVFNRTNIIQASQDSDNGVYRCDVVSVIEGVETVCSTSNTTSTLFLIGEAPSIQTGPVDEQEYSTGVSVSYNVGTNFCIERYGRNIEFKFDVRCSLAEGYIDIPKATRTWTRNGLQLYSEQLRSAGYDMDFFEDVNNVYLMPGTISPDVLLAFDDGRIQFSTEVSNVTNQMMIEDIFTETDFNEVYNRVFDQILGNWTCSLMNNMGGQTETTIITECYVDCGNDTLIAPGNGQVSYTTTTQNSVATFICDNGYILIGSSTRTCRRDRTWSEGNPTCVGDDGFGNISRNCGDGEIGGTDVGGVERGCIRVERDPTCGSGCIAAIIICLLVLIFFIIILILLCLFVCWSGSCWHTYAVEKREEKYGHLRKEYVDVTEEFEVCVNT